MKSLLSLKEFIHSSRNFFDPFNASTVAHWEIEDGLEVQNKNLARKKWDNLIDELDEILDDLWVWGYNLWIVD